MTANEKTQAKNNQEYGASQIVVLEGLEPVRQRPGMYIGSTDITGLHHMIQEIVDNGVDEALAGHASHITVIIDEEDIVTVHDNGRGIPTDPHPKTGRSALETVFTVLHAGGKFEKSAYKISGGLHGVGASVVNALSEWLEVLVHRDGKLHRQTFKKGVPDGDIEVIGESALTGTTVKFKADATIFESTEYTHGPELARMKHGAYLTPGVTFTLVDQKKKTRHRFCYYGGIKTWLANLVDDQEQLSSRHLINQEGKECLTEIAFQYVNSSNENILSFVNNIPTKDHGMHVLGFKSALLTKINEVAKEKNLINKKIGDFTYEDVTNGLYAIVTVKIPEPQFQGQTKGRLGNSYVRRVVEKQMYDYLTQFFADHVDEFDKVFEKVELSARARMAAKIAKETIIRKNVLLGGVLPGKLSDCSTKGKFGTELYIVEGDSAGGSAKQGRDSKFQAILPLKGKILNTENAHIQSILANKEIKNLITAIGAGMRDSFDPEALRYERIIIMTDADVDGAHIRTLLLTYFFRYMRPLIEHGHLYIACPPIYLITQGKRSEYVYPPVKTGIEEMLVNFGFDPETKYSIQRYKGLGEMNPDQLRDTTMDPKKRKMFRVNIEEAEEADRLFRILMGQDVPARKHFILTHAKQAEIDV